MTVQTEAVNTQILGNGSTTTFTWEFNIPSADELEVWLVNTETGARALIDPSEYTATGPFGDENGGDVEYPLAGDPIDDPVAIFIQRVVPYTQPTNISSQDGFNPEVQEGALDWLEFQIQQIADAAQRAIKVAPGEVGLVAATSLVEGDILMTGPDNSLIPGPNLGDFQTLQDILDQIIDIVTQTRAAGEVVTLAYEPSGDGRYLLADGSAVSRTTYAFLFAKIGEMYGDGDSVTTFNLPDYRGRFLRGWADGEATDPDRASRTDRGDGTTGDEIGTKQAGANASHTHTGTTGTESAVHTHSVSGTTSSDGAHVHTVDERNSDAAGGATPIATGAFTADTTMNTGSAGAHTHTISGTTGNPSATHTHNFLSAASGGNESRPTNISVYICITTGLAA